MNRETKLRLAKRAVQNTVDALEIAYRSTGDARAFDDGMRKKAVHFLALADVADRRQLHAWIDAVRAHVLAKRARNASPSGPKKRRHSRA